MTVSYMIIIIIIWKKSSLNIKAKTSNKNKEKSKFRQLISRKLSVLHGEEKFFFFLN
jgi:hypothetical protein